MESLVEDEKKDNEYLNYEMSLENSALMQSIFSLNEKADFDLSMAIESRLKVTAPELPPVIERGAGVSPTLNTSSHHVHTPYAVNNSRSRPGSKNIGRRGTRSRSRSKSPEKSKNIIFEDDDKDNDNDTGGINIMDSEDKVRFEKSDELFFNDDSASAAPHNTATTSKIVFQNSSSVFIGAPLDSPDDMLFFEEGTQVLVLEGQDGRQIKNIDQKEAAKTAPPQEEIQQQISNQEFTLEDVYNDAFSIHNSENENDNNSKNSNNSVPGPWHNNNHNRYSPANSPFSIVNNSTTNSNSKSNSKKKRAISPIKKAPSVGYCPASEHHPPSPSSSPPTTKQKNNDKTMSKTKSKLSLLWRTSTTTHSPSTTAKTKTTTIRRIRTIRFLVLGITTITIVIRQPIPPSA